MPTSGGRSGRAGRRCSPRRAGRPSSRRRPSDGRREPPGLDLGRDRGVAPVDDPQGQRLAVVGPPGDHAQAVGRAEDLGADQERLAGGPGHPDQVAGGLEPGFGRVEEQQALVPPVVVLAVGLEGVRGAGDGTRSPIRSTSFVARALTGPDVGRGCPSCTRRSPPCIAPPGRACRAARCSSARRLQAVRAREAGWSRHGCRTRLRDRSLAGPARGSSDARLERVSPRLASLEAVRVEDRAC